MNSLYSSAALVCALAARGAGRGNPAERGLAEARGFVEASRKLGAVQQALKALPVAARDGVAPVAYFDGKTITVDAGKAQLARDFDAEAFYLCGGRRTPDRDGRLRALMAARTRRDVRLAGALVHEAAHRVDAERGVASERRDEKAAYAQELAFYRGLPKRASKIEVCEAAGEGLCEAAAAEAAKEIEARAH